MWKLKMGPDNFQKNTFSKKNYIIINTNIYFINSFYEFKDKHYFVLCRRNYHQDYYLYSPCTLYFSIFPMRNIYNGTNELGDKYLPPPQPPSKDNSLWTIVRSGWGSKQRGCIYLNGGGGARYLPPYQFSLCVYCINLFTDRIFLNWLFF